MKSKTGWALVGAYAVLIVLVVYTLSAGPHRAALLLALLAMGLPWSELSLSLLGMFPPEWVAMLIPMIARLLPIVACASITFNAVILYAFGAYLGRLARRAGL